MQFNQHTYALLLIKTRSAFRVFHDLSSSLHAKLKGSLEEAIIFKLYKSSKVGSIQARIQSSNIPHSPHHDCYSNT